MPHLRQGLGGAQPLPARGRWKMVGVEIPALGRRGEGWVALQMVALAIIGLVGLVGPAWAAGFSSAGRIVGLILAAAGAALGIAAVRALGSSLTALPRPADEATLRADGVYARARHPIYGAVLLVTGGWTLMTSWWALLPWFGLLAILLLKSHREEAWLTERYEGYPAYRASVRRLFVPFVV
jgi:protein-S-isoprenylcysteine O-methyltransferase Ste14